MDDITTRSATPDDFADIRRLFYALDTGAIESQPEHFQRGERGDEYLCEITRSGKSDFILAIYHGEVVGFSLIYIKEVKGLSLLVPCAYAYIQDFVVAENHRNKGVGAKLLEESKRWGKARGAQYLRLSVLPDNEAGRRFYLRNGLDQQMITMECSL
jgi:ribosomal protein S18 acetylase RimI-like enzyme